MVFQAIVAGSPMPLRPHRPDLDPGLEAVVLRAIEMEPARRFPSVEDLGRALWRFASERSRMLWRDAFGPVAPGAAGAPAAGRWRARRRSTRRRDPATPPRRPPTPAAPTPGRSISDYTVSPPVSARSSRRIPALIGVLALAAVAVVAFRFLRSDDDGGKRAPAAPAAAHPAPATPVAPAPRSYTAAVVVEPPSARIELDGAVAGQGRFERTFPVDGADHKLVIAAEGFETRTLSFRDAPPPARITLAARAPEVQAKQPAGKPAPRARRERAPRKESAPAGTRPGPAQSPDDAPIVD